MKHSELQRSQTGRKTTQMKSPSSLQPSLFGLQQQIGNQAVLQMMGGENKRGRDDDEEQEEETEDRESKRFRGKKGVAIPITEPPGMQVEEGFEEESEEQTEDTSAVDSQAEVKEESEEEAEEEEDTAVWKGKRPSFTTASKRAAFTSVNRDSSYGVKIGPYRRPGLKKLNGAMPHRMSYNDIRNNALKLANGTETAADFNRWTDRFVTAGKQKIDMRKAEQEGNESDSELKQLIEDIEQSQKDFISARDKLAADPTNTSDFEDFIKQANSFHANVPDVGPHIGVNNPVQENAHLHVETVPEQEEESMESSEENGGSTETKTPKLTRRLSFMSGQVRRMSVGRISAFPYSGGKLITTDGSTVDLADLPKDDREAIEKHPKKTVKGYDPNFKFGNDK